MGSTKGDKKFFEGLESYFEIAGRSKSFRVKDSPSALLPLKRKLDPLTAESSSSKSKRQHVS
jgi:hypothetical protein